MGFREARTMADGRLNDDLVRLNPLALDLQLCFSLYTAGHLMTRLYRPLLEPLGLTYLQYLAMLALWERAPLSIGELGRRLDLDSGTLTPLFKRMEAAGLVTRTRDPSDDRRVVIAPTARGQDLREKAMEVPVTLYRRLAGRRDELVSLKVSVDGLIEVLRAALNEP